MQLIKNIVFLAYIKEKYYFVLLKTYFFSGYIIRLLEVTIDNCYKCDLETINDPNNSQYFWINRRGFETETKRNWQVVFAKYKDLSTQRYRKELTPNIAFQPNKVFARNGLFEKIIKRYKATNLKLLKLKEKLGLCLYEDICDEKEHF